MRIRRRFALLFSSAILVFFLFLYVLINYAIPNEKPKSMFILENKLKELQHNLNKHAEEFDEIKKQIDNLQTNQEKSQEQQLDGNDLVKDSIINAGQWVADGGNSECSSKHGDVPGADIQMLDVYRDLEFDNPNGGPWTQGWRVEYDPHHWNAHHKLKVFVVPHSHNDPGWIKTFDTYYEHDTKPILSNLLRHLDANENMKFIWAEISYFSRWYDELSNDAKQRVKRIVQRKQLEFVTGGWVMNDEANAHWISILQQLTEGLTWLKVHLNTTPISSWAIDPFGYTPTMPYILKGSGMKHLLIQRTHYSVKKLMAKNQNLEFRWRQIWDRNGETDFFTHMMPFYSYDVPHTCGPDPKVCCQFDFKRLPGYGLTCPWRIAPQAIDDVNVAKRAELIVDQWRKKSVLYKTRSVLIPLGDDFRYSQSSEWEAQRVNYEKLFDYINNEPNLHCHAKFATLTDYFESVAQEKDFGQFPSLSGDFFTYADKDDNYWSGYFTSRPFHKRLDRVLMNFLRSAEMLHAWTPWENEAGFDGLLRNARRALSLFQHHDGVTGTAKDHVMKDYAARMVDAVSASKFIIQQAVYKLLTKPSIYHGDYKFTYLNIDDSRFPSPNENRPTIIIGDEIPFKYVVVHNSLPQARVELVEFLVAKPFVTVQDPEKNTVPAQVSPVWSWHRGGFTAYAPQASTTKYRLTFKATVPPMGLKVYTILSTNSAAESRGVTYPKITIMTHTPFSLSLGDYPSQVEFTTPKEVSLHAPDGAAVAFTNQGLLKSMTIDSNSPTVPIHLEFLKYGAKKGPDRSGAYLFMPDGPAVPLLLGNLTTLVIRGELESSVSTGLPFVIHDAIMREDGLEIRNLVDIGDMGNTEIVMRFSTPINNGEFFYTDLNGFQVIKRQRFSKIPLQANYYPVPTSMFIEDDTFRFTLLTAQSLGGASLKSGQMEIMQDRRLNQDDNRGLGQGVLDNQPIVNIFKLILELRETCETLDTKHPAGFLTSNVHWQLTTLTYPMDKLVYHENDWVGMQGTFGENHEAVEKGIEVAVLRDLSHMPMPKVGKNYLGIVLRRTQVEKCSTDPNLEGNVNVRRLLGIEEGKDLFTAPLTLLKKETTVPSDEITLCPMEAKAFIVGR
uniref:Alpha-mannosidase n=1 Tax=Nyssomyia neivai TaxID=330878 RepID=A0A1L8DR70_9DIPT